MATETQTMAQHTPSLDPSEELVDAARKVHTQPLWTQMARLNPPLPNPICIPHIWRYDEIRPSLLRAGELVTEQQAERRVLMLVNPARGTYAKFWASQVVMLTRFSQMRHTPPTPCMQAFNSLCRMRRLELTVTWHSPCGSLLRVKEASPQFTGAASTCSVEM